MEKSAWETLKAIKPALPRWRSRTAPRTNSNNSNAVFANRKDERSKVGRFKHPYKQVNVHSKSGEPKTIMYHPTKPHPNTAKRRKARLVQKAARKLNR